MPGHSVQNISSANAAISAEPLVGYQNFIPRIEIPIPIARSFRIKKMLLRKSGKVSVSQAAALKSQSENSAARCFVILGREPKLLSEKKLTRAQSLPKYTRVYNSVRCHISTATSAATTVRSTQLARRTYIRNPAVHAIDKEGSHQHYLHGRIRRLISIIATCAQSVDREMRLLHFALDSYSSDFDHEFTLMKSKVGSNDYESQLKSLTDKIRSFGKDMITKSEVFNYMLKSYANDLGKKIMLLNSKIAPYAHDLEMQIMLTNSKIKSYADDINSKRKSLNSKSYQFLRNLRREFDLFRSRTVFV